MSDGEGILDREPPSGIKRLLFRVPILLYKIGLGTILGDRFLKLTHTGRKSGLEREVMLKVVKHDEKTGVYYIASGWGEKSDWFPNIMESPRVGVQVENRKFIAMAKRLSPDEAGRVLLDYALRHPRAFTLLAKSMMGEELEASGENVRRMAERVPVIALEPES